MELMAALVGRLMMLMYRGDMMIHTCLFLVCVRKTTLEMKRPKTSGKENNNMSFEE